MAETGLYITLRALKLCKKNCTHTFRPCKNDCLFSFLKIDLYEFYEYTSKEKCLNHVCLSESVLEMLKPHLAEVK